MVNGRKAGNTGEGNDDRKHLTSREVERLIEATKGSRNEVRDRIVSCVLTTGPILFPLLSVGYHLT
jgi:hypothetical protein